MNVELMEALNALEKEKDISKETLFQAIENSLIKACENHFGKADNVKVSLDRETGDYELYREMTVVEDVEDRITQISLNDARQIDSKYQVGDIVRQYVKSKDFGRIAATNAKNVILQKIREEERRSVYDYSISRERASLPESYREIWDAPSA